MDQTNNTFPYPFHLNSKPSSSTGQISQQDREINDFSQRVAMEQQVFKNASYADLRQYLPAAVPPLDCPGCQDKFTCNEELQKHIIVNLNVDQPGVLKCSVPYNHVLKMEPDACRATPSKPYNCPSCARIFKTKGEVKSHVLIHTEDKPYKCTACIAQFKRRTELRRHELVHLNVNPYKCMECAKAFRTKGELKSHFLIHSTYRQFKCTFCNLQFKRRAELNRHRSTHQTPEPSMCADCSKHMDNPTELREHLMDFHGAQMLKCPQCSAEFTNDQDFKRHGEVHKSSALCSACGHDVTSAAKTLNGALLCSNCAKVKLPPSLLNPSGSNAPRTALEQHKEQFYAAASDVEGVFACNQCDRVFKAKPQLQSHKITHSPLKAYRCLECGAEYRRKAELQRHAMIHLQISPFGCPSCVARFRTKGELKSHMLIHSTDRPYKCFKCHAEYKRKGELRNHQSKCLNSDGIAPERSRMCQVAPNQVPKVENQAPPNLKEDQRLAWPSPCIRFSNFPFSYGYGLA